jgi:hypothetical protein
MNGEGRCCRDLIRLSKGLSPFDRAIVLGWYDGPTEGLVRCGTCGRSHRFELLDSVDEDRGVRLYRLAPVPADTMDRLDDALARFMAPSWPMWVPLWKFPTEDDHIAVDRAVDELMARAAAPEFVIATSDLLDEIVEIKAVPASATGEVHDWISWMGLAQSPAEST